MANSKKNYRKIYPSLNDEIINVLEKSDRKMEYQQYDLKVGKFMINNAKQTVIYIPCREDSYERLLDEKHQFAVDNVSVEDIVIRSVLIERLHICIKLLTSEEQNLIEELFYKGRSERNLSDVLGIPRMTIHDRKVKTLAKLRRLIIK